MKISDRFAGTTTFAYLLVGFLSLLGIVGMTFWLSERAQVYFDQAIEARDTRGAAVSLRNAVQVAESAQRGFLLTGNEIYLAPYMTSKTQANRELGTIGRLLAPYPNSAVPMQRLSALVAEKFGEMDATISLKREGRDQEALAIIRTNKGKALMDEGNVFVAGIIAQADARLTAGVGEQRANASWLRLAAAISAAIIIAMVAGAGFVLLRYTAQLREARDEVRELNIGLETRISDRTAELSQARDRAEVLLSEVNHRVANSLALVSSLVSLQAKAMGDEVAKRALSETQARIMAISLVHRRLYDSKDARSVSLDEYLSGVLDQLKVSLRSEGKEISLKYNIEPIKLETDRSINVGVVVTEWVTNAFKYAYPERAGEVRVSVGRSPDDRIELVVEDDGVGRVDGAPAQGTGLGSRIVKAMAASIGGEIQYQPRNPGMAARMTFASVDLQPAPAE